MTALNPHALEWPVVYQYEEYLLRKAIPIPDLAIEHIGSTAVQTLYARPTIDIMIGIPPEHPLDIVREPLLHLGYLPVPCEDVFPGQQFFVRIENDQADQCQMIVNKNEYSFLEQVRQTHHIHVVEQNGSFWNNSLRVRDHLRLNKEDKRIYEIIKKHLANSAPAKIRKYEKVKSDFINAIISL